MLETALSAAAWAREMWGGVELGDARRTRRLVRIGEALTLRPSGTLPAALPDWADLKGAYRLFSSDSISHAKVIAPHVASVRRRCMSTQEVLLIEDTTSLNFTTHIATSGLGRIGNDVGSGFHLHTTLAFSVLRWNDESIELDSIEPDSSDLSRSNSSKSMRSRSISSRSISFDDHSCDDRAATCDDRAATCELIGLFAQRWWARGEAVPGGTARERKPDRLSRKRESERWSASLEELDACTRDASSRWTFVADREGDIYEVFEHCASAHVDFIIRASQNRALMDEDRHVFDKAESAPVIGMKKVKLRARPGQKARVAKLEIRATQATIRAPWRPVKHSGKSDSKAIDDPSKSKTIHLVLAREIDAPKGVEPVRWLLTTSWPIISLSDCRRVIAAYEQRWLIEEYHKCLKTGCSMEQSQLESVEALTSLLGVTALVSLRLLDAKLQARARPDDPIREDDLSESMLAILEKHFPQQSKPWTNRELIRSIARLGGFLGRKGDGEPGWQTLWRGWQHLTTLATGYELAMQRCG